MGIVYILHFQKPYKHARHYTGYSDDLSGRIYHHRNGTGARLTQVIKAHRIKFVLAVQFDNVTRCFERKLKSTHNISRYCPLCHPEHYRKYHPRPIKALPDD